MSKYSNSNYDGEFSFTFPNISHFKGLLEHLKFTNEKHGNFIFNSDSIEYQSSGFNGKLFNLITLDVTTFPYQYDAEDSLAIGLDVGDLKGQLSDYDKNCQIKIEKYDGDDYVNVRSLNANGQLVGSNRKIKIMNIEYEIEGLPEYNKSPTCIILTSNLAKRIAGLCSGSKSPSIVLYCCDTGILIEARHKADTVIKEDIIGDVDINNCDKYVINHNILKAITKIGSINKDKHTRIFYRKDAATQLRFVVPISDGNGVLNVCMKLEEPTEDIQH